MQLLKSDRASLDAARFKAAELEKQAKGDEFELWELIGWLYSLLRHNLTHSGQWAVRMHTGACCVDLTHSAPFCCRSIIVTHSLWLR
jgi:hypothetical protein